MCVKGQDPTRQCPDLQQEVEVDKATSYFDYARAFRWANAEKREEERGTAL